MVRSKLSLKLIGDEKRRKNTFIRRRRGLQKKARELSILCDVPILLLSFGPHGQNELIWPEGRMEANAIAERFRNASAEDRLKSRYDISTYFGDAVMKQAVEERGEEEDRDLQYLSEELLLDIIPESSLQEFEHALEARLREIEERMEVLRRGDGFHLTGGEQDAADGGQAQPDQEGQALQFYDLMESNPPGEEILQGTDDYWGNPNEGGFYVDPAAFLSGLHVQPLLNGGAAAPPPVLPPAYTSRSFATPPLQTYGEYVMETTTYMSYSMTCNPQQSAGALVGCPYHPDAYSMVYSAPAITPTAFMLPWSSGATFLDPKIGAGTGSAQPCVTMLSPFRYQVNAAGWGGGGGGGAREQAASSSNNGDGRVHSQEELNGDGLGFLRDEPIEEGVEKPFYPDHPSGAIALTPLAADSRWAGFTGS